MLDNAGQHRLSARDALRNKPSGEIQDRGRGDYPTDNSHAANRTMDWSRKADELDVGYREADKPLGLHLAKCVQKN